MRARVRVRVSANPSRPRPCPQVKVMRLQNKIVKATIWDTAGQERFRTLTSSYYRGAHGVLLVYDVTRPETFQHLNAWLSEIEMYSPAGGKHVVKLLVGNKSDLEADRAVSTKEGEEWARSKGMLFLESSAKSGEAVKSVFEEVVSKVLESPALLASAAPGPRAGVARLDAATPPVARAGGGCCK
jgi:Ras-related protein Rab-18